MQPSSPGTIEAVVLSMHTAHLKAVAEIEYSVFDTPWTSGMLYDDLCAPCSCNFVARCRGSGFGGVVGYLCACIVADECTLNRIACAPGCCGRGIGKMLMAALLRHAAQAGAKAVFLEVSERNVPAWGLYKSCGFSPVGRRKNYYSETGEDAVVMRRSVSAQTGAEPGV